MGENEGKMLRLSRLKRCTSFSVFTRMLDDVCNVSLSPKTPIFQERETNKNIHIQKLKSLKTNQDPLRWWKFIRPFFLSKDLWVVSSAGVQRCLLLLSRVWKCFLLEHPTVSKTASSSSSSWNFFFCLSWSHGWVQYYSQIAKKPFDTTCTKYAVVIPLEIYSSFSPFWSLKKL